jgi:hypothetical protein
MSHRLVLPAAVALAACLTLLLWGAGGNNNLAYFAQVVQRREALEARSTAALKRLQGKHRVAAELIAGRLTLREAAESFRQLGGGPEGVRSAPPAPGSEEEWCLAVLRCTRVLLEVDPVPNAAAVLARLEKEFQEHFGHAPELSRPTRPRRGRARALLDRASSADGIE